MYAWLGIPACWNALTLRPPPCGFCGLRQERSFALLRILQECPYPMARIRRRYRWTCGWFEFEAKERGARQRYFWSPMCGLVGQLVGATKGIIMGFTSMPHLAETSGHTWCPSAKALARHG